MIEKFFEDMLSKLDTKELIKNYARALFSGEIPINEEYVKYGDAFIPVDNKNECKTSYSLARWNKGGS